MNAAQIIALTPTAALELHARGVGGDDAAITDYVRWCAWRKIDAVPNISTAKKAKALMAFMKNITTVVDRG